MARWKITKDYRKLLSDKLMDLGNLIGGALIFGQFISGKEFSVALVMVGFTLMLICYVISYIVIS